MSRTHESGGFQGAISSMLSVADTCPNCGKLLGEHKRQSLFGAASGCPDSVRGAFPFISVGAEPTLGFDEPTFADAPTSSTGGFAPTSDGTATGVFAAPNPSGRPSRRSDLLAMTWNLTNGSEDFP